MKSIPSLIAGLLLATGAAFAQTGQQRLDAVSAHMKRFQELTARLPQAGKAEPSSGTQHLLHIASKWDRLASQLGQGMPLNSALKPRSQHGAPGELPPGVVSDPDADLQFSRMLGFTQSETSTAWYGKTVVVAYNDSGSFIETLPLPATGLSFNGYSVSTDGGRTFTDQGFLNPGPSIFNFLEGDPVVACSDENTFYQSSIFSNGSDTAVSFQKSTDGGKTFGDPVEAVSKDPNTHFLDKPWMAVDPSNPKNVYVTYTDFDFSGNNCSFLGFNIELVRSADGGATWSAPTVIDVACFPDGNQGSNVSVDGAGNVLVAWEHFPAALPSNEIDIAKSSNHGVTFKPKVKVSDLLPVGNPGSGLLQGGFRNNEFPSLAIDRSQRPGKGPIYVAWNDGKLGATFDLAGGYNFGDVFVSRSDNGGASWSTPVKVNETSPAPADHYLPGVAVDRNGSVGVCFYDRSRDPQNFLIERQGAWSTDGGQTWKHHRVTKSSFAASIAADSLIKPVYMGDYDGVTADTSLRANGFLGSYGDNSRGNPDVKISRRFGMDGDSDEDSGDY